MSYWFNNNNHKRSIEYRT